LDAKLLLCIEQKVILRSNLWVELGLVNCAIGRVTSILYIANSGPPSLPLFIVVNFPQYKGLPWVSFNQTCVPISPISRGSRRKLPLRMAWALRIHKLQGMTLPKETIDIGNMD
jgi:ATP-dependent exoDNAse (exonuclease V) alpha subunit